MREKHSMDLDDFQLRRDYLARNGRPISYISTPHDPSVGIYGIPVSPNFFKVSRMQEFWRRYGKIIIAAYNNPKLDAEQFERAVKRITKGWR